MKKTLALTLALGLLAASAQAGTIERACNKTGRDSANRSVCACIQQVADITLRRADQGRAAKLLGNPEKAHATWMSQSRADDAFWERYQLFGTQAEAYCAAPAP